MVPLVPLLIFTIICYYLLQLLLLMLLCFFTVTILSYCQFRNHDIFDYYRVDIKTLIIIIIDGNTVLKQFYLAF